MAATDEERAQEWSDLFAVSRAVKYIPSEAASLGVTRDRYTRSYLKAFVDSDPSQDRRHIRSAEDDALEDWFLVVKQHTQAAEYDGKY
jgi:hypothetical protein